MIEVKPKKVRCAIYTRKSSDEGLDQEFNSLDSQRESCEAYIKSQQHEGWVLVEKQYNDGGYSGGTLDRPSVKELFKDIEAGLIDIVVVYKVDRLTRSLMDFSKIVELFDKQSASFVSITQQFNTTTSMGRLTLNILLSFAQFEREVTGERIRDKIAASKKKGMWVGGAIPLGYKKVDKKLVPDEEGAKQINLIFNKYLELKSVHLLKQYLEEQNIKSPNCKNYMKGQLYYTLSNKIFIGKIKHKEAVYEGEHEAIIDEKLFNEVQQLLLENKVKQKCEVQFHHKSLLAGLIFDDNNNKMTPSASGSGPGKSRYYVSQAIKSFNKDKAGSVARIPAKEIEKFTIKTIKEFLQHKRRFQHQIRDLDVSNQNLLLETINNIGDFSNPKLIRSMLRKVVVSDEYVEITLCKRSTVRTLESISRHEGLYPVQANETETPIVLRRNIKIQRVHERSNLLIIDADDKVVQWQNPYLVNAIVKCYYYHKQLLEGKTLQDIQDEEGLKDSRYVRNILDLKYLPPTTTESILNGTQPSDLSLQKLFIIGHS